MSARMPYCVHTMCGITGYIGQKEATEIILEGLHALEYRGYDSAGIAVFKDGGFSVAKAAGRVAVLEERLAAQNFFAGAHVGIGHTRWATHGVPSDINAHPHGNERVQLVHNGIIENYAPLRKLLLEKGADMTAVNKFGKNALQLAEEGALAYQSSFDLTKTEVSKAPVDSFIRAYEKAVAGLPPEHAPEFMEAMKKAVGRQSFVETGYVLQLITRSLSSKNLLTEEQSGKFREEITGAIAENSRIIDVRGVAFEHTVDLLRKAAEK